MTAAKDLTQGTPLKVILLFTIPIILGNIFQQFYAMVDSIVVGRCVSCEALAGIGAVNGILFIITGFILGLTGGFGVVIAQNFGAKDYVRLHRSVAVSLLLSTVASVLITVFFLALLSSLLDWIGTPSDIYPYAIRYLGIIVAGIFSQVAYNLAACILRAVGDSRTPLVFIVISSVLNLLLDLLLIAGMHRGVSGAALATIIAQSASALACFIYTFRRFPELRLSRRDFSRYERTPYARILLRTGLPMAFQFSITGVGLILLQVALNKFPTDYIAGFTAANKIQNVSALAAISFGVAIANFVGQNAGAQKLRRVAEGVRATMLVCLGTSVAFGLAMGLNTDFLTSLFMKNPSPEVLYASGMYMKMSAVFLPLLYLLLVYRNALQGMGLTFWPLAAGFLELGIRAAVSLWLPPRIGYPGVALVDVLAWSGACVLLTICYYLQQRKNEDLCIDGNA